MNKRILILIVLIAIALMFLPTQAGASDGLPEGIQVFEVGDHTCVLYEFKNGVGGVEAELECFCPCLSDCVVYEPQPTLPPTDEPKEPTPVPPNPTPEPTPEPPDPTKKPKCNSGRGNGSEGEPDCDPGNSEKNQGGD